jgi:hypothetical protein
MADTSLESPRRPEGGVRPGVCPTTTLLLTLDSDPDYLPPSMSGPDDDPNDPIHHPPRDPNCQHQSFMLDRIDTALCNVRSFHWTKGIKWTCRKQFDISKDYVCKSAMCRFTWSESTSRTDCGKHGQGPHKYGLRGDQNWDGSLKGLTPR